MVEVMMYVEPSLSRLRWPGEDELEEREEDVRCVYMRSDATGGGECAADMIIQTQ